MFGNIILPHNGTSAESEPDENDALSVLGIY